MYVSGCDPRCDCPPDDPNCQGGLGSWWEDLLKMGESAIAKITQPKTVPTYPTYTPPYVEAGYYPSPLPQASPIMDWLPWIGVGAAVLLLTRKGR